MKQSNNRAPAIFKIGLALLALFVISVNLSGGLYARYISKSSGGDAARVAKFEINDGADVIPEHITLSMKPGDSISYTVEVTNNSEVTVRYRVEVDNTTDNIKFLTFTTTPEQNIIAPGGNTQSVTLTFSWPTTEEGSTSADLSGKVDRIKISIITEQVD